MVSGKEKNISKILRIVSKEKKIARKDLASRVGITPAGVTKITKKLIESGHLVEKEKGDSIGGRPPIMLEINPNKGQLIGMYFAPKKIYGVLTDLHCEKIIEKSIDITCKSKEGILEEGYKVLEELLHYQEDANILGIGVSMNGLVNNDEGISIFSPHYRWRDIPLKEILEEKYNLPVYLDNDVRMMAIAEKEYGSAKDNSSFIMLNIEQGIGAGIVINGEVFQGGSYSAGEIGHIKVSEEGKKFCSCGKKGCLEAEICRENIVEDVKKNLANNGARSILGEIELDKLKFKDICVGANEGDYYCIQIIEEIGEKLAKALGSVINIINPSLFVIDGQINECKEILYPRIKLSVQKYSVYNATKNLEIRSSTLKRTGAALGAISMIYKKIFEGNIKL